MALQPSAEAQKTVTQAKVPNKRERASAQFGQLDSLTGTYWDGNPDTIQEAIERLAAAVYAATSNTPIP